MNEVMLSQDDPPAEGVDLQAFWHERRVYRRGLNSVPRMRQRFVRALMIYLVRRLLWAFAFFPVFLSFWIPLVIARFNPVAAVQDIIPVLQSFVHTNPEQQAIMLESVVTGWLSVGLTFAIFDLILTPFRSPYDYEADVHMRAWVELNRRHGRAAEGGPSL